MCLNKSLLMVLFKMNSSFAFTIFESFKASAFSSIATGTTRLLPLTTSHRSLPTSKDSKNDLNILQLELFSSSKPRTLRPPKSIFNIPLIFTKRILQDHYHPYSFDIMWKKTSIKTRNPLFS